MLKNVGFAEHLAKYRRRLVGDGHERRGDDYPIQPVRNRVLKSEAH